MAAAVETRSPMPRMQQKKLPRKQRRQQRELHTRQEAEEPELVRELVVEDKAHRPQHPVLPLLPLHRRNPPALLHPSIRLVLTSTLIRSR